MQAYDKRVRKKIKEKGQFKRLTQTDYTIAKTNITILATRSREERIIKKTGILFSIEVKETYLPAHSFSLITFHSVS